MKKGELFQLTIFLFLIIILHYLVDISLTLLPFIFIIILGIIHFLYERKLGKKNFSYKAYKSKKSNIRRILLGFLAGIHYFFFIGNYSHKNYNTQVWYPETLECYFGNISLAIIFFVYIFISINLIKINLYLALLFMIIPIITTLISLIFKK